MSHEKTVEERKAEVLIELRGYRPIRKERISEDIISYLVEDPRSGKNVLIWCVLATGTVGVQYVNRMRRAMEEHGIERGIMLSRARYTQTAKSDARKRGIELIPRIFPAFNIFKHRLVPKHEIVSPEEREMVLKRYRVKPYQLPKIRASDPAVLAIGAKPGDIVKIIRDSPTAGKHITYRYVIEE